MSQGVIYLNIGTKHIARMAVSLLSLRETGYTGRIAILQGSGNRDVPLKIAKDSRINADLHLVNHKIYKRHTAYAVKASMWKWTPFQRTLFVDSDTTFEQDPFPLLSMLAINPEKLILTQFANWTTNGGKIISGRVSKWANVECDGVDVTKNIKGCLERSIPAVNTGVIGFHANHGFLRDWERLTVAGSPRFMADELSAQILCDKWLDLIQFVDDSWNYSCRYSDGPVSRASIVHYHGAKHLIPGAIDVWYPHFLRCRELNIGDINHWIDDLADKRLKKYLDEQ